MTLISHELRRRLIRPGFSLMEIVVVIGVAVVLLGTIAFLSNSPTEEEALRVEHGKIEDLVRQGRALAVSYQQTFVVELSEGQASLSPLALPNDQYDELTGEEDASPSLEPLSAMQWPRVEELDPQYELSVRRWGQQQFNLLVDDEKERWLLEPGGLCEPVSVRLSKDFGDNSLARIFHPLSGLAEDEELTITGKR